MDNKSVIYRAVEKYYMHLQLEEEVDGIELELTEKCLRFLESGTESEAWLKANILILIRALAYYDFVLKSNLDDAKITCDSKAIDEIRAERKQINAYRLKFKNEF